MASGSGCLAGHSWGLSCLPTGFSPRGPPTPRVPNTFDKFSSVYHKPLPHSDPCWAERKLLWGVMGNQEKSRPIPWGKSSLPGICQLAGAM